MIEWTAASIAVVVCVVALSVIWYLTCIQHAWQAKVYGPMAQLVAFGNKELRHDNHKNFELAYDQVEEIIRFMRSTKAYSPKVLFMEPYPMRVEASGQVMVKGGEA